MLSLLEFGWTLLHLLFLQSNWVVMFLNKKIINCNNKQELSQDHKKYFSIMWIHYCLQELGITLILIINTNLFESHRMDWYVFKNKKSCTSGNSLIIIELNLASYFKIERDKDRKFFWNCFEGQTLFLVNFLLYSNTSSSRYTFMNI